MKCIIQFFLILNTLNLLGQETAIEIGYKYKLESEVLEETRSINVYLPHSYKSTTHTSYPVIYLMDGDYNFHYVTGLMDQLAVISERIPEMIIVGIDDKGHADYVKNCTPYDKEKNPTGNSELFLDYLLNEVKPYIKSRYKISDFDVLIGHSLGGLFTINTLLQEPESFENYIAISPSLWWNDFNSEKEVEAFFKKHEKIDKRLYLSIGNEMGMGVLGFQNQIDINTFADAYYKNEPLDLEYEFNIFKEENHNSVGLISIKTALEKMFENYELPKDIIENIKTFEEYDVYLREYQKKIGDGFQLPKRQFKYVLTKIYENDKENLEKVEQKIKDSYRASLSDYYNYTGNIYLTNGDLEKAKNLLQKSCEVSPTSLENIVSLSEMYLKEENKEKAKILYEKALKMAIDQKASNWYLNQLESNVRKLE
jgi:hypothetical protein